MAKSGCHVDAYGFKHCYINEGLLLHYLCSQLNHHYAGQLSSCEQNNMRWKDILKQETDALPRTVEYLFSTPRLLAIGDYGFRN